MPTPGAATKDAQPRDPARHGGRPATAARSTSRRSARARSASSTPPRSRTTRFDRRPPARPHRRERRRPERARARRGARPALRAHALRQRDLGRSTPATGDEIAHVPLHNPEPPTVVERAAVPLRRARSPRATARRRARAATSSATSTAWPGTSATPTTSCSTTRTRSRSRRHSAGRADFHPMKGPMTTQSLRGMANHGPMHWRGDRTGGNDPGGDAPRRGRSRSRVQRRLRGPARPRRPSSPTADMQAFTDFILAGDAAAEPDPRPRQLAHARRSRPARDFYFGPLHRRHPVDRQLQRLPRARPGAGLLRQRRRRDASRARRRSFKIPHLRNMYQKVGMFGMPAVPFVNPATTATRATRSAASASCTTAASTRVFRFLSARRSSSLDGNAEQRRRLEQFMLAFDTDLRRSSASR